MQSTQNSTPIASALKIESADALSVQIPVRDADLPTQVEITFPNYDVTGNTSPHALGVAVAESLRNLFVFSPSGVVFVK